VELARICGWEDFHVRAGRTRDSWRVPGSGSMAAGWPDLCLVKPHQRRLLFIEVKRSGGKLTHDQERVLDVLKSLVWHPGPNYPYPTIEVLVWRPEDWPFIEKELAA